MKANGVNWEDLRVAHEGLQTDSAFVLKNHNLRGPDYFTLLQHMSIQPPSPPKLAFSLPFNAPRYRIILAAKPGMLSVTCIIT